MALTKETKHEARGRGDYVVICREWTIIKKDNVEVSRTKTDNWIHPDSDYSSEPDHVKAICAAHFTASIKSEWGKLNDDEKNRFGQP
jgi:hypothetical protein